MKHYSGIYKITNNKNNKTYIGSTADFSVRWATHKRQLRNNEHPCKHLQAAWNKYGQESFDFSIICFVPPNKDFLLSIEQYWLNIYWDNHVTCYNTNKLANSRAGVSLSEEHKRKIGLANKGNNHRSGIVLSDVTKEKIAASNTGKIRSDITKQKISNSKKGKPHTVKRQLSDDHKRKISEANTGRKHSNETKKKISTVMKQNAELRKNMDKAEKEEK